MEIVAFSQRDPRWRDEALGTGELTIGQAGCLLTAVASLLATWGVSTDPARLNRQVQQSYGFVDDNLFVFASVDGLACRFARYIDCATIPAPVAEIEAAIAARSGVLLCVDATPGGKVQPHWVWAVNVMREPGKPDQWGIVDPWRLPGQERVYLDAYLAKGWTPARGIFAAAIYDRIEETRALTWRSDTDVHQGAVCVR